VVTGGELVAGDDAADERWVPAAQVALMDARGELTSGLAGALTSWGALP
jgi:hypothetical protein